MEGIGTTTNGVNNAFLTIKDGETPADNLLQLTGTAEFAFVRRIVDVDVNRDNLFLLKDATLDTIALTVDNAGVNIADVANLTVSGELALAQVTANGESQSRYMTLQMGNVTVDGSLDADLVDLTATFEIAALDLNLVNTRADGTPWTHLNWNQAVDLDEDGTHDVLNPGADLPNPRDLTLNLEHTLRFRLSGRMEGIGTTTNGVNNAFLTIKDGETPADNLLQLTGTAEFAFVRRIVDVDVNRDNLFLLKDATLDTIALTVDNAGVNIADVANLTVSGELALAQVTANGESQSRYMTLQMGNVTVDGSLDADLVDLTATFEIAALDLNLVNTRADGTPWTHLNWNQAVESGRRRHARCIESWCRSAQPT